MSIVKIKVLLDKQKLHLIPTRVPFSLEERGVIFLFKNRKNLQKKDCFYFFHRI